MIHKLAPEGHHKLLLYHSFEELGAGDELDDASAVVGISLSLAHEHAYYEDYGKEVSGKTHNVRVYPTGRWVHSRQDEENVIPSTIGFGSNLISLFRHLDGGSTEMERK